jgi:hypothetical protein
MNAWHSGRLWPWTGGLAALCLAAALLRPSILKPLNRIWLRFGLLLHGCQPDRDGLAVLWHGFANRSCYANVGTRSLAAQTAAGRDTYWIVRQPPGPLPETMRDQF